MRDTVRFVLENSLFLIFGALAALVWANVDVDSYHHLQHLELFHSSWLGHAHFSAAGELTGRTFTLHFLVNDVLMALFFAIAGKEVWEATLPGGPLNSPKQAAAPLIATIGGMAGPVGIYLLVAAMTGSYAELANGWAVPTATDIAFSYLIARMVFGAGHPAIPFLLLLAIADDALGLIIIAVFYPQGPIELVYMLLPVAAMVIGVGLRRMRIDSFWPYVLICGPISWIGFHWANLHPALGLLPIIPVMPHAHVDEGLFSWKDLHKQDTLNRFEHWFKNPVEVILGMFGLLNAGVLFSAVGSATWAVLAGLLVGKPVGIMLLGYIGEKLGFTLPKGMNMKHLLIVAFAAGIGFTVSIFVATVAFPAGPVQDAAKIGALGSFAGAALALIAGSVLKIEKIAGSGGHGHGHH